MMKKSFSGVYQDVQNEGEKIYKILKDFNLLSCSSISYPVHPVHILQNYQWGQDLRDEVEEINKIGF